MILVIEKTLYKQKKSYKNVNQIYCLQRIFMRKCKVCLNILSSINS